MIYPYAQNIAKSKIFKIFIKTSTINIYIFTFTVVELAVDVLRIAATVAETLPAIFAFVRFLTGMKTNMFR